MKVSKKKVVVKKVRAKPESGSGCTGMVAAPGVDLEALRRSTIERCKALSREYGVTEAKTEDPHGEGVTLRIRHRIIDATQINVKDPVAMAEKAYKAHEMHCLALWAAGKATGPATSRNLADKAKKAESLARMLDERGADESAIARARERAETLKKASVAVATGKKVEMPKPVKATRPQKRTVGIVAIEMVLAGKTDEEIKAALIKEFNLPERHYHYPRWYRLKAIREGLISKEAAMATAVAAPSPGKKAVGKKVMVKVKRAAGAR